MSPWYSLLLFTSIFAISRSNGVHPPYVSNVSQLLSNSSIPGNLPFPRKLLDTVMEHVPFNLNLFQEEQPLPSTFVSPSPLLSMVPSPPASFSAIPSLVFSSSPSPSQGVRSSPLPTPMLSPSFVFTETPPLVQSPPSPSSSISVSGSPFPSISILQSTPLTSPSASRSPFFTVQLSPSVSPSFSPKASLQSSSSTTAPPTTSPSPSFSSFCRSGCRCESPGELLGESSFDESELEKFGAGQNSIYFAPNWASGPVFRNEWDPNLVQWDGNKLSLTVEKRIDEIFYGAAIRTHSRWYGYGCVSACMKPIDVSGIISSLFTYTGKYDGIGGSTPNQNEIDIEFEGHDTTKVQFNFYTNYDENSVQRNEYVHDLGYDASQSYNVYGFRWTPWGIQWEVNGQVVKEVSNENGNTTPVVTATTVQKVMANAWIVPEATGPFFGGVFDSDTFVSASAEYRWIRYEKLDEHGCCAISDSC